MCIFPVFSIFVWIRVKNQGAKKKANTNFSLYSFFVLFLTCFKHYAWKLWS